jgi:hypothetical protein
MYRTLTVVMGCPLGHVISSLPCPLTLVSSRDLTRHQPAPRPGAQATKVPQLNVTDSFGSITLVLPAGATTYRVETRNSFGSTTVTVPQSPSARNVITASDNSGDIRIVTQHPPATPASSAAP